MRARALLVLVSYAACADGLPKLHLRRVSPFRRRMRTWSTATKRAARKGGERVDASLSEIRGLLHSRRREKAAAGARGSLARNALAGAASAVAVVPEACQFALVAGAHPLVGLGSTLIVGGASALFGGRPGMVAGASASCAIVLAPLVRAHGPEAMRVAVALAGALQLLVGLLKGGRLSRMVPQPVVLGFVNGLAVKVLRAQVDHFQHPRGVWLRGDALYWHSALAVLSFALVELAPPALTRFAPAPLLATGGCALVAQYGKLPVPLLRDVVGPDAFVGGLSSLRAALLPAVAAPSYEQVAAALPVACELAAVGVLQSLLTLQLVDGLTRPAGGARGRASRECRALGAGNLVSGLCGGMGGCGLLGQSLVNLSAGGSDRASSLVYVGCVLAGVLFGGAAIGALPVAALVGLMVAVARHTFSWSSLRLLGRCRAADALTILLVSALTATKGLAVAVAAGICATSFRFAYDASFDLYSSHEMDPASGESRVVELYGTLFFGSASGFADHVQPTAEDRARRGRRKGGGARVSRSYLSKEASALREPEGREAPPSEDDLK